MAPRPSYGEKWDYIRWFAIDPCDAPWQVYVEAAKWPAIHALVAYLWVDFFNIIAGAARPQLGTYKIRTSTKRGSKNKSFRGGGRKMGGGVRLGKKPKPRSFARGVWQFIQAAARFDSGEFFGATFPGTDEIRKRQVTPGVGTMWEVLGIIERPLYWWMIFGITTDFFFEWSSNVMQSSYCQSQTTTWLYADDAHQLASPLLSWSALLIGNVVKQRGAISYNLGSGAFSGAGAILTCTSTVSAVGADPVIAGIRVRNLFTGETITDVRTIDPGAPQEISVGWRKNGGWSFSCEKITSGGFASFDNSLCTVVGFNIL